MKQKS